MEPEQKFRLKPTPSQMSFALPLELKEKFAETCAEHDISASQKIRQMMNRFIQESQKEASKAH
ncbi:hypothetical protein [Endozoicomonas ascidiicola]|uniref:hypothetical protein n=1 Tax=Endozoicomonas ascidiicola TaxID=1698521 RepID=UPI00082DF112|nr:hypothetical protein [Endozoicomonas ascidiicola]